MGPTSDGHAWHLLCSYFLYGHIIFTLVTLCLLTIHGESGARWKSEQGQGSAAALLPS